MNRRFFLKAMAAGVYAFANLPLLQAALPKMKVTRIRAYAPPNPNPLFNQADTVVTIETDAGITGYGEAGSTGPMARARIQTMKPLLAGKDPLLIEVHFHNLTTLMHTYMAHIPTISGIDMALWDLAGKITGLPVCTLLGGRYAIQSVLGGASARAESSEAQKAANVSCVRSAAASGSLVSHRNKRKTPR